MLVNKFAARDPFRDRSARRDVTDSPVQKTSDLQWEEAKNAKCDLGCSEHDNNTDVSRRVGPARGVQARIPFLPWKRTGDGFCNGRRGISSGRHKGGEIAAMRCGCRVSKGNRRGRAGGTICRPAAGRCRKDGSGWQPCPGRGRRWRSGCRSARRWPKRGCCRRFPGRR